MAKTAKSISAEKLRQFTRAAVRDVTRDVPGKFIGTGPIMGYILDPSTGPDARLDLATNIAEATASVAREEGVTGLRPKPVVVIRPDRIIAGYILPELPFRVTGT